MTQFIQQENIGTLSIEELRHRLTQLFNALAAHQRVLAECADLTEAMQAIRQEIRRRRLKP